VLRNLLWILLLVPPLSASSWISPHGGPALNGLQQGQGNLSEPRVNWSFESGQRIRGGVVVADLDLDGSMEAVISSFDGKIYVLNAVNGAEKDSLLLNVPYNADANHSEFQGMDAGPVVGDVDGQPGLEIVVGDRAGNLSVLSATADLIWQYPTNSGISRQALIADLNSSHSGNEILFTNVSGSVLLLNRSGSLIWQRNLHGVTSAPALWGELLVLAAVHTDGTTTVHALWPANGSTRWQTTLQAAVEGGASISDVDDDGHPDLFMGDDSGTICRINGTSGAILWGRQLTGVVRSPPALGDLDGDGFMEAVVGHGRYLVAWNATDGTKLWEVTTADDLTSQPTIADLHPARAGLEVVAGGLDRKLWLISADGEPLWVVEDAGSWIIGSPAVADVDGDGSLEVVYSSDDGFVYMVDTGPTQNLTAHFSADDSTLEPSQSTNLRLAVMDGAGGSVANATITFAGIGGGSVQPLAGTTDANGQFIVLYTAAPPPAKAMLNITAHIVHPDFRLMDVTLILQILEADNSPENSVRSAFLWAPTVIGLILMAVGLAAMVAKMRKS